MTIDKKTKKITVNRGDKLEFTYKIPIAKDEEGNTIFYTILPEDEITFGVYEENGFDKPAVILEKFQVNEPSESIDIVVEKEKTKIGELINEPVDYWYEIVLNDETTTIGYTDEEGPKIFKLMPEGSNTKEEV